MDAPKWKKSEKMTLFSEFSDKDFGKFYEFYFGKFLSLRVKESSSISKIARVPPLKMAVLWIVTVINTQPSFSLY